MAWLTTILGYVFPDGIIYALTAIVFLIGIFKCCGPVFRNGSALRRATDLLKEGAKAKLSRPVWTDQGFLGKRLQPTWRTFLQSADMGKSAHIPPDVAEYVHDDSVITEPGKATLAELIPGLCTSLGILGTFVGLSMGLSGLDVMEVSSYMQLTSGIALAFNTSIVGIIASIIFNVTYNTVKGRARDAVDEFTNAFYAYAIAQPPDATMQVLAYEREQADALGQFTDEMGVRMAGEIQRAITTAMAPVARSMDDFLNAATRAQVDGLDYIVARFIDRMNTALDGQLHRLGQALADAADGQLRAREELQGSVDAIGQLTQRVIEVNGVSEQVIDKFAGYVGDMGAAYRQVSDTQADTGDLLEEITEASLRQSKYLSALQEYQAKLQGSFQDYTVWTDKFVGGLEERTASQNTSLEQVSMEMRASGELLRGAYKSFTESIELGLANALGLFDENMQNLMRQVNGTLEDIQGTMTTLESTIQRATTGAAQQAPAEQEVN